jgi:YD repeat-containing protein
MKKIIILIGLFPFFLNAYSQSPYMMDIATPNMTELGKYGQIPVSYFNGLPNIIIPLYTIKCKDIELPISLSYHAGGNKTETHPTWVGLGWNLNAGGSITRVINGGRDELRKEDFANESHTGYTYTCETGYYWASSALTDAWSTESFMTSLIQGADVCKLAMDTHPDEFCFNYAGNSGSFYFASENGVLVTKIKSKENQYTKIEPVFSSDAINFEVYKSTTPKNRVTATAYKTFLKFIITDKDGFKYEFGGDTTNIDFATSSGITVATSWHLSKIISPTGNNYINLLYSGAGVILNKSKSNHFYADYIPPSSYPQFERNDGIDGLSMSALQPKYLKSITTSENQVIDFTASTSSELDYNDWVSDDYNISNAFKSIFAGPANAFDAIWSSSKLSHHYYMKLDEIQISSLMTIKFQYSNPATQRLRLNELSILPFNGGGLAKSSMSETAMKYSFKYNSNYLPQYNSRKSDNWGYYNGIDYSIVHFGDYGSLMYDTRVPNTTLMKAEILEKIHYPTGGVTVFAYEPHDYSKVVAGYKVNDITFKLLSQAGSAGGLRIKTITSYPDELDISKFTRKTFSYVFDNGTSSGILSGIPQYSTSGSVHISYNYGGWSGLVNYHFQADYTVKYFQESQNLLLPLSSTDGNHVTYSRVIEKNEDNSSTIYNYTNHEEYLDEVPVKVKTNIDGDDIFGEFTSRELERGLLKSVENYDNTNRILAKTINTYNQNPDRYNDFIKHVYKHIFNSAVRLSALKIYTFTPYLSQQTETLYDNSSGSQVALSKETNLLYDSYNNLKSKTVTTSDGGIIREKYKYPYDKTDVPYPGMVTAHILSPVVEQSTEKQLGTATPIVIENTVYKYYAPYVNIYVPQSKIETKDGQNPYYDVYYTKHDNFGHILSMNKSDNITEVYLWSYNSKYPVARIIDSDYDAVKQLLPQVTIDNATTNEVTMRNLFNTLRTSLPNALITSYTYKPFIGISSITDPNGVTTYYEYDTFNRLTTIRDQDNKIIKQYEYYIKGQ